MGFAYARRADRLWPVPLRDPEPVLAELARVAQKSDADLPPVWLALLPLLLPIVLITLQATVGSATGQTPWVAWLRVVGEKNVAVGTGRRDRAHHAVADGTVRSGAQRP